MLSVVPELIRMVFCVWVNGDTDDRSRYNINKNCNHFCTAIDERRGTEEFCFILYNSRNIRLLFEFVNSLKIQWKKKTKGGGYNGVVTYKLYCKCLWLLI